MPDIVFYEAFDEEEQRLRKYLAKDIKAKFTWKTIQEANDKLPLAPVISIRTQSIIPNSWAPIIKGVLTRSQGYDHLLRYRQEISQKIKMGYLGNYCARAVAEHAVMAMMVVHKKLKQQIENFKTFFRDGITGEEMHGKKVLVVGVGSIGQEIVRLVKGLNMPVQGVDIIKRNKNLRYVPLAKGVSQADVIFCALPLTDKTENMFNYACLKKAKKNSIFINVSRGEISPLGDLEKLLKENILAGISLDVYPQEEKLAHSLRRKKTGPFVRKILKLSRQENVLFTPHNAFNTFQAVDEKAKRSADAVKSFFKNHRFPYPIPQ